ncbi:MAG: ubiquinone biosynthesis protein UbiE, partial [Tepidisphaeraceae bacterium]
TTWGPRLFEPANSAFWDAVRDQRPDLYKSFNPWDQITDPAALEALLRSGGAENVRVVAEPGRHALIAPSQWWSIVMGTGYRGVVEQLDPAAQQRVREACFKRIANIGVTEVETNVVYGLAIKG